jgi:hypothetical protein
MDEWCTITRVPGVVVTACATSLVDQDNGIVIER